MEKIKEKYLVCLNNIASNKTSSDYRCMLSLIDQFCELQEEREEVMNRLRMRCQKIVSTSKKYTVAAWMHWLLGPYYVCKYGDDTYGR